MKLLGALSLAACTLALPQRAPQLTFAPSASIYSETLLAQLASLPASHSEQLLAHVNGLPERRLVQFQQDGPVLDISEGEKALLVFEGRRFVDVTDESPVLAVRAEGECNENANAGKQCR